MIESKAYAIKNFTHTHTNTRIQPQHLCVFIECRDIVNMSKIPIDIQSLLYLVIFLYAFWKASEIQKTKYIDGLLSKWNMNDERWTLGGNIWKKAPSQADLNFMAIWS